MTFSGEYYLVLFAWMKLTNLIDIKARSSKIITNMIAHKIISIAQSFVVKRSRTREGFTVERSAASPV